MSAHCTSCITCRECGHPAYCLDDHPATYPCPHGEDLCGDCLECCGDCLARIQAELDIPAALAKTLAQPDPFARDVDDPDPFASTIAQAQAEAWYGPGYWAAVKKQQKGESA